MFSCPVSPPPSQRGRLVGAPHGRWLRLDEHKANGLLNRASRRNETTETRGLAVTLGASRQSSEGSRCRQTSSPLTARAGRHARPRRGRPQLQTQTAATSLQRGPVGGRAASPGRVTTLPVTGRVVLRAECGDHGFVPFSLLSPISFRVPSPVPPPPRSVSAVLTKSRHSCFCVFFFSFCHFPTCSENRFPLTLTSAQGAPPQGTAGGQSQPATDISRGRDSCVLLSVSV